MYQSNCSCYQDAVNKVRCARNNNCCCNGFPIISPTGPCGSATITIGTTTTGAPGTPASVTNSGTSTNAILNFTIPAGIEGNAPELEIGTVTTGAPGSEASVTITEI